MTKKENEHKKLINKERNINSLTNTKTDRKTFHHRKFVLYNVTREVTTDYISTQEMVSESLLIKLELMAPRLIRITKYDNDYFSEIEIFPTCESNDTIDIECNKRFHDYFKSISSSPILINKFAAEALNELVKLGQLSTLDFSENDIFNGKILNTANELLRWLYNNVSYSRRLFILDFLNYIEVDHCIVPNQKSFYIVKEGELKLTKQSRSFAINLKSIKDDFYQLDFFQALPLFYSFLTYEGKIRFRNTLQKYINDTVFKKEHSDICGKINLLKDFLELAIEKEITNNQDVTTFAEDVISYCSRLGIYSSNRFEELILVNRKVYTNCKKDRYYKPRERNIVITMCFKFKLSLEDSLALLKKAGFTLNQSTYDSIIHICLQFGVHDIEIVNQLLTINHIYSTRDLLGLSYMRKELQNGTLNPKKNDRNHLL